MTSLVAEVFTLEPHPPMCVCSSCGFVMKTLQSPKMGETSPEDCKFFEATARAAS